MKWIVGLGNPGAAYRNNRHNVGFMVLDRAAERWGITIGQNKFKAQIGEGHVKGQKVYLIKPMTYMNLSGESMRAFMDFYKVPLEDCVVVYDDLDTPFGQIRLRYQGSAGGHNGIKSIIQHMGTQTFDRIRVGVSRPAPGFNIADYVLADFTKEEAKTLPDIVEKSVDALEFALEHDFNKTMAKFNA
ncbi:aminoacyl-tRNA hydrolase [Paenibacillus flagellatus]|uniref:Peptidyl-tRNA hydrolase n=1 Tax=Paenibacillus flagellatus TaxID=2211139 RepID=A0A2V5K8X5_9BACL|nr:aminoacyl-tRNA hydrolase [Paenibacillus flagellatus]PYI50220.1 aminoacyl-tRNA hydrolase [Paenibacillus flagellatus]